MNLPDSVKIGARTYAVEIVDADSLRDHQSIGMCNKRLGVIQIADCLPPDNLAEVFFHEVLHALINDSGWNMDSDLEERIVEALSPRLTAFLADNPDCLDYLLDLLEPL